MNCGVSTTPCGSVSRPSRARVEPSAGGGTCTSKRAAPGMVRPRSARRQVVPQGRHVRFRATWRRDLVAEGREMGAGSLGRDPALRGPVEEAEAQQERLVDVLDRLDLLGQDRGQGRDARPDPTRTSGRSRPAACDPSCQGRRRRSPGSSSPRRPLASWTVPSPWTSAWSRTREQPVHDAWRAAAARGDEPGRRPRRPSTPRISAERSTIAVRSSSS